MVPEFVERTGGSKWNRALPGAEFGNSNLWFPNSSKEPAAASGAGHCPAQNSGTRIYGSRIRVGTGGSKWQSALPTGSKWVQV